MPNSVPSPPSPWRGRNPYSQSSFWSRLMDPSVPFMGGIELLAHPIGALLGPARSTPPPRPPGEAYTPVPTPGSPLPQLPQPPPNLSALQQAMDIFDEARGNVRPGAANIPPPGSMPDIGARPSWLPPGIQPPGLGVRPEPPTGLVNPFMPFQPTVPRSAPLPGPPPSPGGSRFGDDMPPINFPPVTGAERDFDPGPAVLPMPAPELPDLSGAGIYPGAENYMRQQRSPAPRRQRGQRSSLLDILDQVALLT